MLQLLEAEATTMKYNLGTFPLPVPGYEEYDHLQRWIDEVLSWKNQFEKELREIIEACQSQPVQGENSRIHLQTRAEAFKEILGESP